MKFSEIASRITGLSGGVFGISWQPKEAEIDAARRVITFLEDRRVLYTPSEMEMPDHCVQSVVEIRRYLTEEIGRLHGSGIEDPLRALRAACRKFLDVIGSDEEVVAFGAHRGHWASWVFNGALGELRGVFGVHVAQIAARHGLDVEDNLAAILPAGDDDDHPINPPKRRVPRAAR